MKCTNCQNEQSSGKFCGVCGTPFSEEEIAQSPPPTTALATVEQNTSNADSMNNVRYYWNDFLRFLKQPLEAFRADESAFARGMITLLLYMTAFTLSIYFISNSLYKFFNTSMMMEEFAFWEAPTAIPFFEFSYRIFFFSLVGVVISLVSIFIVSKIMKLTLCPKTLVAQYGALMTPFLFVNVITILFALSGTVTATFLLLGASMFYGLLVAPILFIYHHGMRSQPQRVFYGSIGTSVIILFLSYFMGRWMLIEKLSELGERFNQIL
ncbi:hypothetical protein GCM10010954_31410 [Halobacillus andaensis]|uniref:Zinc ribbon domain-containing protein n=1 Tax=Halobacillus andaensis TaxID=1176239 RepID=A0A917B8N2_HALAA|nr:hypothetical protein [Halobacillus andaensis]MBP2005247.1 hypothetical protein [Halobacillus andaensis]GGF29985.1 hypothetical protein GCM10010954_31410 [Halobacillus andaensis]